MRIVRSFGVLAGIAFSVCVHAQGLIGFGAVTGIVRDYTGSGIPDTTVALINEKLGIARTMSTTDEGTFHVSALVPGPGYTLKVTRVGFLELDYPDFEVLVGHTLNFDISVVQEAADKRSASEKASVKVEDSIFELQNTFPESEVEALPTRNRDVNTLAPLSPAVVEDNAFGKLAFHGEAFTNASLTDGVWTTNSYFYDKPPIAPVVTQEAVAEVQIVSAGASAEFGHTMGGDINVATRGGGDAIHGALYDYFNNHSFNAADRYAPDFRPPGWQHQFGLNAGGPALSNFFWFVNLEDLDGHFKELNQTLNPLLVNPAGTAIAPSNCTATTALCASAVNFLNAQLNRQVQSSVASLSGLAKLDWRPNDFNDLGIEVDAGHRHSPNGTNTETVASNAGLLGYNGTYTDESRFAKASYIATWSGNAVNEVRAGWYHERFSDYEDPALLPSTGAVGINIAGTSFGGNPQFPIALSEQRYQLVDNFTVSLGSHFLKIGVDYSTTGDYNDQIFDRFGEYNYPTLTSFAEDFTGSAALRKDYTSFTQTFGQPVVNLHTKRLGIYAQDTWRIGRRLTVDFGLLFEKTFIPQPTDVNPTFFQTSMVNSPDIDFAPRLGIAYQLDRHTVIRAGMGSFYQPFPGQLVQALFTGNAVYQLPVTYNSTSTGAPVFPKIPSSPGGTTAGITDVLYAVTKPRSPLSAQGAIAVERSLGKDLTVSLNYLYSRGVELWTAPDQNLNPATVTKTYTIDNAAGVAVGTLPMLIYTSKVNADFAHVYQLENDGSSWYNSASIQIRKRMSHGVSAQASYTWSHALDDISGTPVVAGFVGSQSTPGAFRNDRGNSPYNQPNRAIITWVWQPNVADNSHWEYRYVLNGWQLSGSGIFASALGETPIVDLSGQQFTGTTMLFPNSLNGSGGWSRVPFQPVNSLLTGPEYDVDARLTREIRFTGRIQARLMFEAFNALNKQYNTSVNTIAYLATSGVLHPIPGVGAGTGADGSPWGDNARHLQVALRIVF
jgi:hypothetical protein